jgi:hypothetical protein
MHLRETAIGLVVLCSGVTFAQQLPDNIITLDNQSSDPAVVKILGPTTRAIDLPASEKRMLKVAAGNYDVILRYGRDAISYRYVRANSFSIDDSASFQRVSITLTADAALVQDEGRYPMRLSSREEFEKVKADRSFPFSVENESNDYALARLEGEVTLEFPVSARSRQTVQIPVGVYTLKVRYGDAAPYRYARQASSIMLDPWHPIELARGGAATPIVDPSLPAPGMLAKLPQATPVAITAAEFRKD